MGGALLEDEGWLMPDGRAPHAFEITGVAALRALQLSFSLEPSPPIIRLDRAKPLFHHRRLDTEPNEFSSPTTAKNLTKNSNDISSKGHYSSPREEET